MHHAHALEIDAAIALVSLIVAIVGGAAGLFWLAGVALRHWLRGRDYPSTADADRHGLAAGGEDGQGS